ncbi:MAG: TRAP transporter small permease [Rubrivivax sp.]|jgi:TRAP-type C4-dicarboxylate transport system permease small subunit|nr:TRAP transporter small permease [Rubrivivax sp.]
MTRWLDAVARGLETLLVLLMGGMVVLVFGNVVLRYAFNSGITLSEELSRWFFIWMTFMGAVLGLKDHAHLGTDVLVSRLKPAARRACLVVAHLLMLWCTWLIFSGSLTQTRINWDVEAPVTGWSMAWVYGAGVVFAVLTAPLLLRDLWRALSGRLRDDELVMVQESEELSQRHGSDAGAQGKEPRP